MAAAKWCTYCVRSDRELKSCASYDPYCLSAQSAVDSPRGLMEKASASGAGNGGSSPPGGTQILSSFSSPGSAQASSPASTGSSTPSSSSRPIVSRRRRKSHADVYRNFALSGIPATFDTRSPKANESCVLQSSNTEEKEKMSLVHLPPSFTTMDVEISPICVGHISWQDNPALKR